MAVLHFLDVGPGDCSIIKHASGRITTIDVCKARSIVPTSAGLLGARAHYNRLLTPAPGAHGLYSGAQLRAPFGVPVLDTMGLQAPDYENAIAYMKARDLDHIFRHIQSHTDMDHMDGIADLFAEFPPANFWDTANTCEKDFENVTQYREKDWLLYRSIREGYASIQPRRLVLYSGSTGSYWNTPGIYGEPHDNLYILAPTPALVQAANQSQDFNDCSYVILWSTPAGRVLFCGDSHDKTWEHILANYLPWIVGVELMIAPHHGRDSERDRAFLSAVKPKLTLFGRAPSEHLAYDAWSNRDLAYITSNQCGTIVVDASTAPMKVFVTKGMFAQSRNPYSWYNDRHRAWFLQTIS
jgi:beta-lactamase superfamily II metal-dependent hydrolase